MTAVALSGPINCTFFVEVHSSGRQRSAYACAETTACFGMKVADLVFHSQIEPPSLCKSADWRQAMSIEASTQLPGELVGRTALQTNFTNKEGVMSPEAVADFNERIGVVCSDRLKGVERVLVNLTLPRSSSVDQEENKRQIGLISAIADLCRGTFPKLNPQQSTFIVHRGFERIHVDEVLLPIEC